MSVLDWVVVRGGLHGVCAASALKAVGAELRIVDPSGALLQRWSMRAGAVAMTWMRSPVLHHLANHPTALHRFVHRPENADVAQFAGPCLRPTHAAFLRHSQHVARQAGLVPLVVAGTVAALRPEADHLVVEGPNAELRARRVLIATGSNHLRMPAWAPALRRASAAVHHVFEPGGKTPHLDVVGGGISAVQRALQTNRETGQSVRLWMRRKARLADFDYERAWSRARFLGRWSGLDDARRLAFVQRHGSQASVPSRLWSRLTQAVRKRRIELVEGEPTVQRLDDGRLLLSSGRTTYESNGITLATGLEPARCSDWLARCSDALDLPTVGGLPRLGEDMQWGRGVYVSGALAGLRLGPMASNIIGARWATSHLPGVTMMPT